MKLWLISVLMLALVATTAPTAAEAKRLAGGKPAGMQRNMPARTAPEAAPAKPAAAPQQAAPAATPAAPPAAAPKRNWMGPLAGLAAGLGIGALLSHFGMGGLGGGLGSMLSMLLLLGGGALLVMFLLRRFGPGASRAPALAGAGAGGSGMNTQVAWPTAAPREPVLERQTLESLPAPGSSASGPTSVTPITPVTPTDTGVTRAFVPAAFDAESFTRTAKLIFIRLQAANDTADLDDLRRFTTPELFASIRLDIQERGSQPQQTDVVKVDAEVLDVVNEADRQVVSVRFHGQVIEEKGGVPAAFNEVWHLVKPHDDSHAWAIAGIEPLN